MKKSVRNIVSLVTSTCLVASLGVFSANADELIEISTNNDNAVEQSSTNNAVADTATKSVATQSSTATKSASTVDDSSNAVADVDVASEGAVAVTVKTVDSADTVNDASDVDSIGEISLEGDVEIEAIGDVSVEEVEDEALADEGEAGLGVVEETDSDTTISSSSSSTNTSNNASVITSDSTGAIVSVVGGEVVDIVTEAAEETVAPVTKDVILTLDTSYSMNGTPKELVKQTAVDLVTKILANDENARIALVGFNNSSSTFSIYDDETGEYITYFDDADTLIAAISDMIDDDTYGDDSTSLLNALYQVKFLLETSDGDEKSVVIMTDGTQGTNLMDEDGNVDYDIPDRYVFGDDSATATNDAIIQFTNDELKPLATIYAVGYFQNLAKEDADIARDFLQELASDGEDGTRYYEANGKNIDEITDLITQDIVHKAIKDAPSDNGSSSSSSSDDTSDSPKTSDAGVAPVMVVSALAGAMLLLTKKKNK